MTGYDTSGILTLIISGKIDSIVKILVNRKHISSDSRRWNVHIYCV